MHPRISLHQVAFAGQPTADFVEQCRRLDVAATVVTSLVTDADCDALRGAVAAGELRVATVNHNFATFPDLAGDGDAATERLLEVVELSAALRADHVYLLTGGRGTLTWEEAADRFAVFVARGRDAAARSGVTLLVENASPFNADIHLAHTLSDTIALAELAGVGVCIDVHACWTEAGLASLFRRAAALTGLVQVSDYVLGDRSAPCRAVPGDGHIPLRRILADVLNAGYRGPFDVELVGPRIEAEGAAAATARAVRRLAELLHELGL